MAEIRRELQQHHSGIRLSDILFALFKRKRTIILCAILGIIAAAAFYFYIRLCTSHRPNCWCGMFWKGAP